MSKKIFKKAIQKIRMKLMGLKKKKHGGKFPEESCVLDGVFWDGNYTHAVWGEFFSSWAAELIKNSASFFFLKLTADLFMLQLSWLQYIGLLDTQKTRLQKFSSHSPPFFCPRRPVVDRT